MLVFEEIKRYPFLSTLPACPLSFNARMVFSYLTFRNKWRLTAQDIGRATGLCRSRSIGPALAELSAAKLVVRRGDGWQARAVEGPYRAWFQWRKDGCKIVYHPMPCPGPECPLRPRQFFVYSLIVSLLERDKAVIADKYLVILSRLNVATVRAARVKAFKLGLLVDAPGGWLVAPVASFPRWFVPKNATSNDPIPTLADMMPPAPPPAAYDIPKATEVRMKLDRVLKAGGKSAPALVSECGVESIAAFLAQHDDSRIKDTVILDWCKPARTTVTVTENKDDALTLSPVPDDIDDDTLVITEVRGFLQL